MPRVDESIDSKPRLWDTCLVSVERYSWPHRQTTPPPASQKRLFNSISPLYSSTIKLKTILRFGSSDTKYETPSTLIRGYLSKKNLIHRSYTGGYLNQDERRFFVGPFRKTPVLLNHFIQDSRHPIKLIILPLEMLRNRHRRL